MASASVEPDVATPAVGARPRYPGDSWPSQPKLARLWRGRSPRRSTISVAHHVSGGKFEVVSRTTVRRATSPRPSTSSSGASRRGEKGRRLLGATGTGKVGDDGLADRENAAPDARDGTQQDLAAQLANELREMLPNNAVEYFVSYYDYYQPEAYIAQTGHLHREGQLDQRRRERLRHSATSSLLSRRDVVVVASVSCIYGLGTPQSYLDRSVEMSVGDRDRPRRAAAAARRRAAPATTCRSPAAVPGARRHRRDHPVV